MCHPRRHTRITVMQQAARRPNTFVEETENWKMKGHGNGRPAGMHLMHGLGKLIDGNKTTRICIMCRNVSKINGKRTHGQSAPCVDFSTQFMANPVRSWTVALLYRVLICTVLHAMHLSRIFSPPSDRATLFVKLALPSMTMSDPRA